MKGIFLVGHWLDFCLYSKGIQKFELFIRDSLEETKWKVQ